jgi:hypothetical protein
MSSASPIALTWHRPLDCTSGLLTASFRLRANLKKPSGVGLPEPGPPAHAPEHQMSDLVMSKDKNLKAFVKEGLKEGENIIVGIMCIAKEYKQKTLIATDRRIVLYSRGSFMSGPKSYESITYDNITSIEIENKWGLTRGFKLTIHASGNDISVHCVEGFGFDIDGGKKKSHQYRDAIIHAIESYNSEKSSRQPKDDEDPISMIKKLAELCESGLLSEHEFDAKKADLLSKI